MCVQLGVYAYIAAFAQAALCNYVMTAAMDVVVTILSLHFIYLSCSRDCDVNEDNKGHQANYPSYSVICDFIHGFDKPFN